jgi:DNA primase
LAPTIPEEIIAEIKDTVDILAVVGDSVLLKKAGRNYQGLCPFHSEKTPSFTVSPEKQMFYCFGCGEGGNVFSFLMKQQGVTFPEAVKILAERAGIALPERRQSEEQKRRWRERETVMDLLEVTRGLYRKTLRRDPRGQAARDYLANRGFHQEILDKFHVGFAPAGWDNLTRYFQRRGFPLDLAEKAGLVAPRRQGKGYYDRFRNRIIFPIRDQRGRVIAFGGRVLDDSLPKYLNSPESAVYHKSRSLYALDVAQSHCRTEERVYIVEGYLDVMALHQNGLSNTVGTLGTALTRDHVRLLRNCIGPAGRAILVFDSDEAGLKAAHRSIAVFAQEFVDARILVLPPGHDPDTFMREFGPRAFIDRTREAKAFVPFLIDTAIARHGLSLEGRIKVLQAVAKPIAAFEDPVARSVYVKYLAEKVDIDEAAILAKIRQATEGLTRDARRGGSAEVTPPPQRQTPLSKANRIERQLVAMMLQYPDILPEIRKQKLIGWIEDPLLRMIGEEVLGEASVVPSMTTTSNELDRLKAQLSVQEENWTHRGCLNFMRQFKASKRDVRLAELEQQIQEAENENNFELLAKLLKERNDQAIEKDREKRLILKTSH